MKISVYFPKNMKVLLEKLKEVHSVASVSYIVEEAVKYFVGLPYDIEMHRELNFTIEKKLATRNCFRLSRNIPTTFSFCTLTKGNLEHYANKNWIDVKILLRQAVANYLNLSYGG